VKPLNGACTEWAFEYSARSISTSVPGRHIVADEDRRLLEQCGFVDARTRGLCLFAHGRIDGPRMPALLIVTLLAGFMLQKLADLLRLLIQADRQDMTRRKQLAPPGHRAISRHQPQGTVGEHAQVSNFRRRTRNS
jgi:hypothetical protein